MALNKTNQTGVNELGDTYPIERRHNQEVNDRRCANIHWANICDMYMIMPFRGGDGRVLILEDPFKSKFECTQCHGLGHKNETCPYCLGTTFEKGKEENGYCRDCTVGEGIGKLSGKTLGKVLCETCKGTGGILTQPDDTKKNTTMGNVLAVSDEGIVKLKPGDKVIFTNYTGSPFKLLDQDLRIAVEKDVLAVVKQLKSNVQGLNEGTFADLDNTGTPHV